MSDFRDKLKFAAARAAGASRSSAELRGERTQSQRVVRKTIDDATVTLAMVQSEHERAAGSPDGVSR